MFIEQIRDTIAEPRYDTVTVPTTGTQLLTFFAQPIGQGTTNWGGTGAKNLADTNMELAGQLPNPYTFTVFGLRMLFPWNVTLADVQLAFNGCVFTLTIGAKPYLRVPARMIPAGNGPVGSIFANSDMAAPVRQLLNNGWPSNSNSFSIKGKPLVLSPTENFQVTLTWPSAAVAVTTTIATQATAGLPVTVALDGILRRSAQ